MSQDSTPHVVYEFSGGWQRCFKCGRTLALTASGTPKRHVCDPRLPDQEWRQSRSIGGAS